MKRSTKRIAHKTKRRHSKKRTQKHKRKTLKQKQATLSYEDVDYATDIDVLTIMSKQKQMDVLDKVNQFLKSTQNKQHQTEMTHRKQQIEELIKEK